MDIETALCIVDNLAFSQTGHHLNTLQTQIFRGTWLGQTYEEMIATCHCSEPHLKKVGAMLWELLSQAVGEEVNKKTIQAVLERYYQANQSILTVGPEPAPSASHAASYLASHSISHSVSHSATTAQSDASRPIAAAHDLPFPEGPVELGSPLYIERLSIEARCYAAIVRPGALIRITASRQMGKTSLLSRILLHAKQQGYQTVALNLQLVDAKAFQDLDRFLQWLCASVSRKLQLPLKLSDYWDEIFGSKTNCKDYFENYLLPQCKQPLVLALDEVDAVFQYPEVAGDFFAVLRAWYEEAKNSDVWQNLRLVLVHSTDVYVPLNLNQSPLNVGLPIELPEFDTEQVQELAQRHGLIQASAQTSLHNVPQPTLQPAVSQGKATSLYLENSDHRSDSLTLMPSDQPEAIKQVMALVGGHPYLVRVALYHLACHQISLEKFLSLAATDIGPYGSHLRRLLATLEQLPELVIALTSLLTSSDSTQLSSAVVFQLSRMGLVHLQDGQIKLRCELYRQYFSRRLGAWIN